MKMIISKGRLEDNAVLLDAMAKRKCVKCNQVKEHSLFKKDKKRKFGIQRVCKACDKVVWKCRPHLPVKTAEITVATPVGLTPHPTIKASDLPSGLIAKDEPVTAKYQDAVISRLRDLTSANQIRNKYVEDLTAVRTEDALLGTKEKEIVLPEQPYQTALREKMTRDGFSQSMIDGAVRLLPKILKEFKDVV